MIDSLNVDSFKVDFVVIQNTCSKKEDSNLETASSKLVRNGSLILKLKDCMQSNNKMSKQKKMHGIFSISLYLSYTPSSSSSKLNLKGTHVEHESDGNSCQSLSQMLILSQVQCSITYRLQQCKMIAAGQGIDTDVDDAISEPINDEEPMLRSDLRWKPTGRIFESIGLRWIPTGKLFDSCTSKVDSEPPHGLNVDIPYIHECKQTLDVSAGTSINVQNEQSLDLSAGALCKVNKENLRVWLLKRLISQKPLSKWIH
ncbi:hypothetical protein Tco_0750176 [Tanacetum coccineum]|uniref:Uncharacterized protein n=1 Tax=Tanacetum coccineum TaxID=301880 RepID=A0ABQ4Z3C6_9ASTR